MNLYHPIPDSDTYDCLNYINPKDWKMLAYFLGYEQYYDDTFPHVWRPIVVEIERRSKSSDFPSLSGHDLIFSEKAWQILQPLIEKSVELLPLKCDSGHYSVIKVVDVVDCLDYSRAKLKRFSSSGRVMKIESYAFKDECIGDRNIFQLPEPKTILVSQAFKDCIEKNGLKGLIFQQVACSY